MIYAARTRNRKRESCRKNNHQPEKENSKINEQFSVTHKCKAFERGKYEFGLRRSSLHQDFIQMCFFWSRQIYQYEREQIVERERIFSLSLLWRIRIFIRVRARNAHTGRHIWQSFSFHMWAHQNMKINFVYTQRTTALCIAEWKEYKNGIRVGWVHSQNWRKHHTLF